jgi:DNA-binding MarR family transcriptional regulator
VVEAFLSVMRTASALGGPVERLLKGHDLSSATYNVLRILRGAWAAGLEHGRACHEIGEHMVAQVPDVTRLVDRLAEAGLVERTRCEKDRRVVYVRITRAGLDLLGKIDAPLLELHAAQLGHLRPAEIAQLCELLARARGGAAEEE